MSIYEDIYIYIYNSEACCSAPPPSAPTFRLQQVTPPPSASKRRGDSLKGWKDCHLKVEARLWPWMSSMCHICMPAIAPGQLATWGTVAAPPGGEGII